LDRATREPGGAVAPATTRSVALRGTARLLHQVGRATGDADTRALLALLSSLAQLADTVAVLRRAQDRRHQAEAAAQAAQTLRAAAHATGRLVPTPTADLDLRPATAIPPTTEPEQSTTDDHRQARRTTGR
jgi:hypothetical protein